MKPVPEWLLEKGNAPLVTDGTKNAGFLTRTLKEISSVMQNDLLAERFAAKKGLMQGLDPRVRLVTTLFLMLLTAATKSLPALFILLSVACLEVKLSALDIPAYIKRVWLILPPILLIVSIPAATGWLIPGRVLLAVPGTGFYFSVEGTASVLKMVLRSGISISLGYTLVMTSRWNQLTAALAVLHIPRLITAILDMAYRYIFVLSALASELFEARLLRTAGKVTGRGGRKYVGASIAFIFIKASYISEEVYNAMLVRCYGGLPVKNHEFKLASGDFVWMANVILISTVVYLL